MSNRERNVDYVLQRGKTPPPTETDIRGIQTLGVAQNRLNRSCVHQSTYDDPSAFDLTDGLPEVPHGKTMKEVITVLVADDHPVVREGLVSLINRRSELRVVAEAANGREAIEKFLALRPDVGLLDLRMP